MMFSLIGGLFRRFSTLAEQTDFADQKFARQALNDLARGRMNWGRRK